MRAADFMENYLAMAPGIKMHHTFVGNQGEGKVPCVYASDVGDACAVVLRQGPMLHGNKTYNLTGPESLSRFEVAELLSKMTGSEVTYTDMEYEQHHETLLGYGLPEFLAKIVTDLQEGYKAGLVETVSDDVAKLTGHHTSLQDFFEAYLELFIAD